MKIKLLIFAIVIAFIAGCEQKNDSEYIEQFKITRIGNCQYLEHSNREYNNYCFTHKGDCNNPIHKGNNK